MTEAQQLREEGVAVSLEVRGVTLRRVSTAQDLLALVQPLDATHPAYDLNREEQSQSLLHFRRADLTGGPVRPGEVFLQADSGSRHRVFRIPDDPTNILLRLWAETVTEEAP